MKLRKSRVRLLAVAGLMMALAGAASAARSAINDKQVPQGKEDLAEIQKQLQEHLPVSRKATVCIELGGGSGSGVIISPEGLMLTAAHVTGGVGKEFTVIFEDGKKVKAESLGLVAATDCAMAKILDKGPWPYVEYDREDTTKLGDWVYSLGHSGGFDQARGVVVRLGRVVRSDVSTIQSDCNLIGGDSGGPLFDLSGKLVGIHSRVGVRLPENMHVPLREFLKHWEGMSKGEFIGEGPFAKKPEKGKGFLGIATEGRPEGGLRVTKVGRESPAEKAGLKAGDVILKLDGVDLKTPDQLKKMLAEKAPDDRLAFELLKGAQAETLTLRLGER